MLFRSLAADLAERMEANKPGAVAGNYVVANGNVPAAPQTTCVDGPCRADAMATFDISQWQNAINASLPQGSWTVAQTVIGNPTTYTITISWVDRQSGTTFDVANTSGVGSDGGTGERFFYTATRTIFN